MSDYIGTREQVDEYVGSRLVEAAYLGSRKYFDPYSEVSGSLPLVYESRVEHILKNYRIYGTENGAGVETENLFDKDDKGAGYKDEYYLTNNAQHMSQNSNWAISAYIPVTQGVTYVVWWSMYETVSASAPSIEFYTAQQASTRIALTRYEDRGHFLITAPSGAEYARISFYKANEDFTTFAPSDTMITEPIPHGYKIPLTITSGVTEQDVPIYIGSSKLGEEEYIDYSEQKIYKSTEITDVIPRSQNQDTIISGSSGVYRIQEGTRIVSYESVKLTPSISGNVTFKCKVNITAITTYGLRVCFRNSNNSIIASSDPILHQTGEYFASVTMANVPAGSAIYFLYNGQSTAPSSETFDFTISDMALYIDPQDPPAPLPAITAYNGENTLSSTETVGPVTVKGRISTPST